MAIPVQMPKMGISVESCILSKWHKRKGDAVEKGEVLFTYETDKTTVDEESPASGILLDVFYQEGDDVPAMNTVAVIGQTGENTEEFRPKNEAASAPAPAAPAAPVAPAASAVPAASVTPAAPVPAAVPAGGAPVSPRARAYAQQHGADASLATPTGAEGRVTERDVRALIERGGLSRAAAPAKPAADFGPEYTDEPVSNVRKFIAKTMVESLSNMAQLTNTASFDATNILAFRKFLKDNAERLNLPAITVNDIILYAVSRVLKNHATCNAHFTGNVLRKFHTVHMGMAVDTDRGLLVPTLFNADRKTLAEIAHESKALAKSAQAGTIAPDQIKGGTFTVSNLGTLGIESFTPIINPPQTCILGVNTLIDAVKEQDGQIKVYKRMPLSLSYDHRVLDGAPASRFLFDLCRELESFSLNLAARGDMR